MGGGGGDVRTVYSLTLKFGKELLSKGVESLHIIPSNKINIQAGLQS
jgi:hypothetical protein